MNVSMDTDEREPPTEAMPAMEGATTAGAPGTLHLHHLHGLLTALAPLRTAYASAAVDRLRALPLDARRAILPHLLHEHPDLTREPRLRDLADEVLLDTDAACDRPDVVRWLARISGVRAASARDALTRVERALAALASGLADALHACRDAQAAPEGTVPDDATELLAWALDERADLSRASAAIAVHVMSVKAAARDAAEALIASDDLAALEQRAQVPRWWPSPFREAALWSRASAERRARRDTAATAFEAAFARAYVAQLDGQRG